MRQKAQRCDAAAWSSLLTRRAAASGSLGGWGRLGLSLMLTVAVAGCRHRHPQPVVLPPPTPVALIEVPPPANPPMLEEPKAKLPAVPVATSAAKPKRLHKRAAKTASATATPGAPAAGTQMGAPTQVAKTDPVAAPADKAEAQVSTIGALTVGGEQSPRALQDAADLIAANERRLTGLNAEVAKAQAALVSKVRNFQKDAQQALSSGDAEGAKTLATKGKLLLDDLDKPAAQ